MFPEHIETDSLDLRQLSTSEVDVFELYELFAAGSDGVEEVFEYVPQEPYDTVKDASERLEKAESRWADGEQAQYGVFAGDNLAGFAGLFPEWERRSARIGFIDRVGGQYEGRLRNWTPLGDEVADHHRYSVTREEYRRSDP
ncbi:N-acetyltransferase [Halobacteriales archaeon SW_7_65_23]|nr:MAG: N-acetyltransferase [Halobacteriales archaeon SW_7_65_23]